MNEFIITAGFIIGTTFMYATPLIFVANGAVISENSGVVNIGLEGMMTFGAFTGAAVAVLVDLAKLFPGLDPQFATALNPWFALFCAGLGGAFFALLHGIASIRYKADQVISGFAMNFLAPGLALFLSRKLFDGATMTPAVPTKLPKPFNDVFGGLIKSDPENILFRFLDAVFNQNATVFLALLTVVITWYVLYKTRLGLRIRAVGEHPKAADTVGVNIYRVRYGCVIMSGFFAGLGGAAMSIAVVSGFRTGLISGHGFIAIAAMIFGKWRPGLTLAGCLLFGATTGIQIYLGSVGKSIDANLLATLPYIVTILVLIGFVGKAVAPAASGKPYEMDAR